MSQIPQITLEQLVAKIKNGETIPSVEILVADKYIGTFISPSLIGGYSIFDEIRTSAEYLGVRGNIVIPPEIIERVLEVDEAPLHVSPNPQKARKKRRQKAEKVKV
tara:strand:- start:335 stop:652 length:318 start_codon:yes stop_codon:yes gene_type:complete